MIFFLLTYFYEKKLFNKKKFNLVTNYLILQGDKDTCAANFKIRCNCWIGFSILNCRNFVATLLATTPVNTNKPLRLKMQKLQKIHEHFIKVNYRKKIGVKEEKITAESKSIFRNHSRST